jgi:hypothetical protein
MEILAFGENCVLLCHISMNQILTFKISEFWFIDILHLFHVWKTVVFEKLYSCRTIKNTSLFFEINVADTYK